MESNYVSQEDINRCLLRHLVSHKLVCLNLGVSKTLMNTFLVKWTLYLNLAYNNDKIRNNLLKNHHIPESIYNDDISFEENLDVIYGELYERFLTHYLLCGDWDFFTQYLE